MLFQMRRVVMFLLLGWGMTACTITSSPYPVGYYGYTYQNQPPYPEMGPGGYMMPPGGYYHPYGTYVSPSRPRGPGEYIGAPHR